MKVVVVVVISRGVVVLSSVVAQSGFALFGGVYSSNPNTQKAFQNVVVIGSSKTKSLSSTHVVNLGSQKDIFRV